MPTSSLGDVTNTTELVSVSSAGVLGNGPTPDQFDVEDPALSGDGRFVAFSSSATNLVGNDGNGFTDVFVRDRLLGTTERVSVDSAGNQANQRSHAPAISRDGRFVAFSSVASNLVVNDTNGDYDVFVHDRVVGETQRVSVDTAGAQATFGTSERPVISADGRFVAFESDAGNLVPSDTNGNSDVFLRDRTLGITERVSVDGAENQALGGWSSWPSISGDGRFVAFGSIAWNLVAGDTNEAGDVFVRDRSAGTTERVSISSDGIEGDSGNGTPNISDDGRYVAFTGNSTNLVSNDTNDAADVFVRDRYQTTTERVSVDSLGEQANGTSGFDNGLSSDARFVVFTSWSDNLVPADSNGKSDIFVRDRLMSSTTRVSIGSGGIQADDSSRPGQISADGRFIAFVSLATNLTAGDSNSASDLFIYFEDHDQDGVEDTSDNCPTISNANQANADGDEYGDSCEQPNCVTVINHWLVPPSDGDCDGYPNTGNTGSQYQFRRGEDYIGTVPTSKCAANPGIGNEPWPDAWPPDFNDNQLSNGADWLHYNNALGHPTTDPPVIIGETSIPLTRFDLNGSGFVNGADVLQMSPFFGKFCAP